MNFLGFNFVISSNGAQCHHLDLMRRGQLSGRNIIGVLQSDIAQVAARRNP
jgi:hypothetical protein